MRRTAAAVATALAAGLATTTAGAGTALGGTPAEACESTPATHRIAQVQGTGATTPLNGQTVRIEGTVTGDFQADDQLKGFFVQDPAPDDDPRTSDGLFVYSTKEVKTGDRVLVTGRAVEFGGLTELSPVTAVDVCGTARSIKPARVRLPLEGGVEAYEGVLLRFGQRLTATETYQLGRYGEVTVSEGGRLFQPTEGRGGTQAGNDARRLLVDDGSTVQNPARVPFTEPHALRIGDTTTNLTGVLSQGFGSYRLQPTSDTHFARANPRPAKPAGVGGDVKVASFNTLNWFTTLDERGATTAEEQERQIAKLVAALKGLDADAVGLMEVENNGDTAVKALVDRLNAAVGAGTYSWIRHPNPGTDAIHVSIIYKTARLTPVGAARSSAEPVFERPPLVQTFRPAAGGAPFTMIVNHFKSKGCDGATGADRDQGDGQGCFNPRRVTQARTIADLAAREEGPLVLGDLNAYSAEDPMKVLTAAGLVGQTERFVRDGQRYSYVFDGQSGELDHVLAGPELSKRVSGATIWHINSDEPLILDYNTEYNPPGLYRPDAYRSSDHDPVLVGLRLR
ncbi:ExeM/NucH family extracellular endonuclease [Actinomadura rugatobispora]|uniref:ExeM/NucH family extracellular endonuclease n=1 Tax=Actinomadura rugatobispora TaxID=1994 RepID=A0ABW0ZY56_9ACTN|nr:ExeM/NucH family extracellular endonuclease [Actinomadura rugatobispora]